MSLSVASVTGVGLSLHIQLTSHFQSSSLEPDLQTGNLPSVQSPGNSALLLCSCETSSNDGCCKYWLMSCWFAVSSYYLTCRSFCASKSTTSFSSSPLSFSPQSCSFSCGAASFRSVRRKTFQHFYYMITFMFTCFIYESLMHM